MKSIIICFSQSGNTWKVAEHIREGIIEVGYECDIIALNDVKIDFIKDYDLVGLGCPVFYYKEPFNVGKFIDDLPELKGKQWFTFCSHGSVMGLTLISMTQRLKKKGILVIGSHHTYADGSLPFYPYPTVTSGHPDEQGLRDALEFGRYIAECSLVVSTEDQSLIVPPSPATEDWVFAEAEMLSQEFMGQVMPKLIINTGKCTLCGTCRDACPVKGIDIDTEPPILQSPCIYCWHCVNICPVCAIEADWTMMTDMARSNYKRYIQALIDAEARGEFRWHIDPATIDYDNPLYKQRLGKIEKK